MLLVAAVLATFIAQERAGAQEYQERSASVVGGGPAGDHEFPYLVAVFFDGFQGCGGALISADWVVSAAHCFVGESTESISLAVGSSNLQQGRQLVAAQRVIVHPDFDDNPFAAATNDIALVQLAQPVDLADPHIDIISLRSADPPVAGEGPLTVAGWGDIDPSAGFEPVVIAHSAEVQAIPCGAFGNDGLRLCSSDADGDGACINDSGSPLVAGHPASATLVAIVEATTNATSHTPLCGSNTVVIHQRISPHITWVQSVISSVRHGLSTWETNADTVSVDVNASGDGVVAAVKQDGRLYVRRFDATGSFGRWRKQGLDGWASAAVAIDANGRVEVVGVKSDGRLYTRSWTAAGTFGPWQRHGLATWDPDAKPAIATNGSVITFAAVKTDGRLFTRERSVSSGWGAYKSHGAATWAQVDVAVAADGDVWFAATKTDGRLFVRKRIGSAWSGFSPQDAPTWSPTVPPSIAARSTGVVYTATKADGRVLTRQQSNGSWSGFVAHGVGSWGGASVDMTETGSIGLIAVKNAGALYTRTFSTSWGSWNRHGLDSWSPNSLPAVAVNDSITHLAAVKTSGALYTRPIN